MGATFSHGAQPVNNEDLGRGAILVCVCGPEDHIERRCRFVGLDTRREECRAIAGND